MNDEGEVIFREVQKFASWLRGVVALSTAAAVVFSMFALRQESLQQPPRTAQVVVLIILGVLLPIAIALLFWLSKLQTEVRTDGLYVRFFPFHIQFKKFTAEDLSEHYARTYRPIREYGGWGIRCGRRGGKAYNVSGNKGVQLVFKDGKRLLIGSQRADELAEALSTLTQTT
ncbi:MAG: hypothetical protein JSW23_06465 [Planctomycetota bacterium]|nr:MAG: hypothetical protein JSW23_06465 [Planctomycetota bacterium]